MDKIIKGLKILFFTFFAIFLINLFLNNFIVFNKTESLQKGIYFIIPYNKKNLKREDIVYFKMPRKLEKLIHERKYTEKSCHYLLKKIGGLPGDNIEKKENILYINSQKIGKIYLEDSLGRPLPQIKDFVVNEGKFIPIGINQNSFDGRYYGEIPIELIKKKAFLLIPLK